MIDYSDILNPPKETVFIVSVLLIGSECLRFISFDLQLMGLVFTYGTKYAATESEHSFYIHEYIYCKCTLTAIILTSLVEKLIDAFHSAVHLQNPD